MKDLSGAFAQVPHLLAGLVGGIVMYVLVYQLLKLLYGQQANTQVSGHSVVGRTATVTHRIAEGGTGEIKTVDPETGHSLDLRAKAAKSGDSFGDGEEVRIKSVRAGLALVDRIE